MDQRAYPGSLHDLKGVEKWLEDLSREGWKLEEFSRLGRLAKLQEAPPAVRKYYLEPDFSSFRTADEETDAPGEDWAFVCKVDGFFLVYESDDPWAQKPPRRKIDEKDLRKKWRNLWFELIVWVFALTLAVWQAFDNVFDAAFSYYETLQCVVLLYLPGVCFVLVELWAGVTKTYDLLAWRKYVRLQEPVSKWRGMKVFRWGEYVLIPVIVTMVIVVVVFSANIGTRTYLPIWRQNRDIPMVTLDVTEDVIHYAPEPYGPSIDVSFKRRLMIPQDIHINSCGLYENPGDVEAWQERMITRGSADADMRFAYYRLWTEGMAVKLAEDFVSDWELYSADSGEFDDLWFGADKYDNEFLVAREGDTVITIIYFGESTLTAHLDEIFEIVMDYRNG